MSLYVKINELNENIIYTILNFEVCDSEHGIGKSLVLCLDDDLKVNLPSWYGDRLFKNSKILEVFKNKKYFFRFDGEVLSKNNRIYHKFSFPKIKNYETKCFCIDCQVCKAKCETVLAEKTECPCLEEKVYDKTNVVEKAKTIITLIKKNMESTVGPGPSTSTEPSSVPATKKRSASTAGPSTEPLPPPESTTSSEDEESSKKKKRNEL